MPFPDDAVIRIEPIQQTVRPGENARLVCIDPEAGLKQIEYIWKREDGQPLPRSAIRNGNYLDFENIRAEEGGRYICLARTDVSTDRAAAEIYVHTGKLSSFNSAIRTQLLYFTLLTFYHLGQNPTNQLVSLKAPNSSFRVGATSM